LSLPVPLVQRVRAYVQVNPKKTNADAVIDALVATEDDLAELVKPLQVAEYRQGLFRRKETQDVKNHSALPVRMSPENWAAVDQLVERSNADNRSQLCAAALDKFLPDIGGSDDSDEFGS
jgi:hypothetical protein